jgi:hypothetical protein
MVGGCSREGELGLTRTSRSEEVVVKGEISDWLSRVERALIDGGFSSIQANRTLYEVRANYRRIMTWGDVVVTLADGGENITIKTVATAKKDNIYALFKDPCVTIQRALKDHLR